MYEPAEDLYVDVPVFPSLGCLPVKPARGETVRVIGNLGMYAGQPQIRPLSAAHVELADLPRDAVPAVAAAARVGATLLIGPVTAVDAEFFESQAGLEHLRLTLVDPGGPSGAPSGLPLYDGRGRRRCRLRVAGTLPLCEVRRPR